MEKKFWWLRPILVAPLALCALLTLLSAFVNIYLFYIEALLLICVTLYVLYKLRGFQQDMFAFLSYLSDNLTLNRRETLETLPFPMLVAGAGGDIIWYNRRCKDDVFMGEDLFGVPVRDIIPKADPTDPKKGQTPSLLSGKSTASYPSGACASAAKNMPIQYSNGSPGLWRISPT